MELNIEYRAQTRIARLAPLRAAWLQAGTAERYKALCVAQGQREGQFKSAALAYRRIACSTWMPTFKLSTHEGYA